MQRFLKLHTVGMAHARHVVGKLLEAVIGAARPQLALAKLEGDAAFFHARATLDDSAMSRLASILHRTFIFGCATTLARNALCPLDGCQQASTLRIEVVAHIGEVTHQRIARREGGGVDKILVHRLLKNDVPLAEYLLVTEPLLPHPARRTRIGASTLAMDVDGIGPTRPWYVEQATSADDDPVMPLLRRLALGGAARVADDAVRAGTTPRLSKISATSMTRATRTSLHAAGRAPV